MLVSGSLNAPYGARCFLTMFFQLGDELRGSLNAPYGARCFLTTRSTVPSSWSSLNAPYGARCFLTWFVEQGGRGEAGS